MLRWDELVSADDASVILFRGNVSGMQTLSDREAVEVCAAGSIRDATAGKCSLCSPGNFSTEVDSPECLVCPEGKYQPDAGKSSCANCTAGTFCPRASVREQPCPAGTYPPSPASPLARTALRVPSAVWAPSVAANVLKASTALRVRNGSSRALLGGLERQKG